MGSFFTSIFTEEDNNTKDKSQEGTKEQENEPSNIQQETSKTNEIKKEEIYEYEKNKEEPRNEGGNIPYSCIPRLEGEYKDISYTTLKEK